MSVQLKSGTNEYHGSAFFTNHNNRLRARNYFFPQDQPKGKFIFNQWGGTFGGPIRKNSLFFTSFERTTDGRTGSRIGTVPTESMRRGDFSSFGTLIYAPLTGNPDATERQPFPNNQIPENRIHPISKKLVDLMPDPNLGRLPNGTFPISNNFVETGPSWFNRSTLDVKTDWNAGDSVTVFGRFSLLDFENLQESIFGNDGLVGPALTNFGGGGGNIGTGDGNTYVLGAGVTYVLSPNFLVDGNFGFNRFETNSRNPTFGNRGNQRSPRVSGWLAAV